MVEHRQESGEIDISQLHMLCQETYGPLDGGLCGPDEGTVLEFIYRLYSAASPRHSVQRSKSTSLRGTALEVIYRLYGAASPRH